MLSFPLRLAPQDSDGANTATSSRVQVGDQLDRGDDEVAVLYFLERLAREAESAGGALYCLNGKLTFYWSHTGNILSR
eukprot:7098086-Pyramimonas_sp.AAC.1